MVRDFYDKSFIWLQPLGLLTGDFFFSHKRGGYHLVAICDCTGHGVAAAFLTLLCKKALTLAVKKHKPEETHLILDTCRTLLLEDLGQEGNSIRDGMDIALCAVSIETGKLFFSGANRQILVWKGGKLEEIGGDRMPLGYHENMAPFQRIELNLQAGDRIYLFSDGIHSQIGGPNEKTWKRKQFRETIMNMQDKPITIHRLLLEESFKKWKGAEAQTDDVLVVGMEILANETNINYYCHN
jgi:serine phosphatase RsbU (regulator of sigma subunit)